MDISEDYEFLEACDLPVLPSNYPIEKLREMSGLEFWNLTHRRLYKYLTEGTLYLFDQGSELSEWVTLSLYSSSREAIERLCLPNPRQAREYVLVIDPRPIKRVLGPRRVPGGIGIEFFLPYGLPREAIIVTKRISKGER